MLYAELGVVVIDGERKDNTTTHRLVARGCAMYHLPVPERTREILRRADARAAKQAAKRADAIGSEPHRAPNDDQTVIASTVDLPPPPDDHPIIVSIDSAAWKDRPPEEVMGVEVRWLNPPKNLPRKIGRDSESKRRIREILHKRGAYAERGVWVTREDLLERLGKFSSSLTRTLGYLLRDGVVRSTPIGGGRKAYALVSL